MSKRINNRSSNQVEFEKVAKDYNSALKRSGYSNEIKYNEKKTKSEEEKKKRKRKVIWYNPPYCKSVATKIGWKFRNLIKKHFTKENPLSKIFSKNSINLSYSCMNNIGQIINKHNRKILKSSKEEEEEQPCNCRKDCPLNGQGCRRKNIVYEATVTTEQEEKVYVGLTSSQFKERYANHKSDFKYETKKNSTALSSYIWDIRKKQNIRNKMENYR